jgi:hypothetical protein
MVKLKIHKPILTQSTYFMNNTFSSLHWGKIMFKIGGCKDKYSNLRQVTAPQTLSHQFVQTD